MWTAASFFQLETFDKTGIFMVNIHYYRAPETTSLHCLNLLQLLSSLHILISTQALFFKCCFVFKNPSQIFCLFLLVRAYFCILNFSDELRLGHERSPAYSDFAAVARGNPNHDLRAKEPEDGLSEETQVRCLIDQATDPNILGRVWEGWEPWMWELPSVDSPVCQGTCTLEHSCIQIWILRPKRKKKKLLTIFITG